MFREIFVPPGLKAGQNDTRIENAVPQPKGGGVAARLLRPKAATGGVAGNL